MPKTISPEQANSLYRISTFHQEMDNGELRFRLKHADGTAYIRTVADETGGWQNSHFHNHVVETYVVQSGWMGFAELIEGAMMIRLIKEGEIVTTRPTIVHNVYLPAYAVIHTVKHGQAKGEDREAGGDASAFDLATKSLTGEKEVRAAAMRAPQKVQYSEEYRHFDVLIWQVPALTTAIFGLSLQSIIDIFGDFESKKNQNDWPGVLMLLLSIFILCFSLVLARFRAHQSKIKGYSRTPLWKSASTWCQSIVSLQAIVLFGLGIIFLGLEITWAVVLCASLWLITVILAERWIQHERISR